LNVISTKNWQIAQFCYRLPKDHHARILPHTIQLIRVKLPRPVANLVVQSTRGREFDDADLDDARLDLEGNFAAHFKLFAPQNYQVDALQIFTPDVMRLLLKFGRDYDFELVGRWLYIVPLNQNPSDQLAELKNLLDAANHIAPKLIRNVRYYSDSHRKISKTARRSLRVDPAGSHIQFDQYRADRRFIIAAWVIATFAIGLPLLTLALWQSGVLK
ncbi:MAG: hypothetical protein LBM73_00050, partial [Candidatus Nomurabacteria bacterium]|jgi:hypothetical protein|nr:hypothetical protein [Candidatus Nomurabacteria bacterium]